MNKQKIAADYVNSLKSQSEAEDALNAALRNLGSDNMILSLAELPIRAYSTLVQELLGEELMDWLVWWMYETDYGTTNMGFSIDSVDYDPTTLSFDQFWNLINA